jgi:hypothetical protein
MNTAKVVLQCKNTGIIVAEKTFKDFETAHKFLLKESQFGYTKSENAGAFFEKNGLILTII